MNYLSDKKRLIQDIERQCARTVGIEAVETLSALSKCHTQEQCPLFALFPREIRDLIWVFATAPYEDENHQYDANRYYYRPGHTAKLKSETNILLTCRRIWLEANAFPMLQAEQCFWYYREAPDARSPEWMASLSNLNRQNFGHLHLYAQMFAIEPLTSRAGHLRSFFLKSAPVRGDFQPRKLHVTIRHTDWWYWEHEHDLRFKDSWLHALLNSPDLRSTQILKLELETLDYKVDQLHKIVDRLEKIESDELQTHILDGHNLTTKFVRDEDRDERQWSGPVEIDGQKFAPYKNRTRLNYCNITLTWRLKFPQIPNAHIPTMRLAQRINYNLNDANALRVDGYDEMNREQALKEGSHRNYFSKVLRCRDRKKLKAGLWPVRRSPRLELLDAELRMQMDSTNQALGQENSRRKVFSDRMAAVHANEWIEKWEREKSLLRFAP